MPKHSVSKLTHDYLKLYDDMCLKWRSFLGVRTPIDDAHRVSSSFPSHYVSKILHFDNPEIYSYSFTVSPKSSIAIKGKSLKEQYNFMLNSLKEIFSRYSVSYYITFELYEDAHDIHCHGILTFSKLQDIATVKREIRKIYRMPTLKQGQKNVLCHIKAMGYDTDQQKRWIGYCYKDLTFMCKNGYTPIYKIIDGVTGGNSIEAPRQYKKHTIILDDEDIEEVKQADKNKQAEKEREEYLLYEKLKKKFENKKPLEISNVKITFK